MLTRTELSFLILTLILTLTLGRQPDPRGGPYASPISPHTSLISAQVGNLIRAVAARSRCAFVLVSHMEARARSLSPAQTVTLERARPEDEDCDSRPTALGRLPYLPYISTTSPVISPLYLGRQRWVGS